MVPRRPRRQLAFLLPSGSLTRPLFFILCERGRRPRFANSCHRGCPPGCFSTRHEPLTRSRSDHGILRPPPSFEGGVQGDGRWDSRFFRRALRSLPPTSTAYVTSRGCISLASRYARGSIEALSCREPAMWTVDQFCDCRRRESLD